MQHGFIKTAAMTPEIRVADCAFNARSIIGCMARAAREGVRLLVLPELCITGYTCSDLFFQDALIRAAERALGDIARESVGYDMLVFVGTPLVHEGRLYNCAAALYRGQVLGFVPKSNIPNYNEFYEKRHFSQAPAENGVARFNGEAVPFGTKLLFTCAAMEAFTVACEICEDLWVPEPPSAKHAAAGAVIVVNLSASDETIGKADYRRTLVGTQSAKLVCGYVYADAGEGESTQDMVFGAHNLICENGTLLAEAKPFGGGVAVTEIDVEKLALERRKIRVFDAAGAKGYQRVEFLMGVEETTLTRFVDPRPFVPSEEARLSARCEEILTMQAHGLKRRLLHTRARRAVVGISGGLDSCLALLVAVRAFDLIGKPREEMIAVTMPCFGTTARTKSNAEKLSELLGVTLRCVDISASVRSHFRDIGHDEGERNVVYENAQARERTQVLMDIANAEGGLVIGTGDLSELALGWATYNGDHMSMYGVNASVPKTLVRYIVKYAADTAQGEALRGVLYDILATPVSPELLPAQDDGEIAQRTEDLVGPYDLHDFYLYHAVRWSASPDKVRRLALHAFRGEFDAATVDKWLKIFYRRFFAQQFKRSCLPDGPKIGSVSLSPRGDWRMPSDASSGEWLNLLEKADGQA